MITLVITITFLTQVFFGPREPVIFDGNMLDTGIGSAPVMYDWNGDGKEDLLVGTRQLYTPFYGPPGAVVYMPDNSATSSPLFNSWTIIEADGSPITHSS